MSCVNCRTPITLRTLGFAGRRGVWVHVRSQRTRCPFGETFANPAGDSKGWF